MRKSFLLNLPLLNLLGGACPGSALMLPAGDKSEVHHTQTSFISYVAPCYMLGKENVSLCLTTQQGRKAIHCLVAVHCSLERSVCFCKSFTS